MDADQIDVLLTDCEDEHLEFKAARNKYDTEELMKYVSALANEGGGRIVLGVSDDRPRRVVGTQAFMEIEKIRDRVNHRCQLRTTVEEVQHPVGRVLVFNVPRHPVGVPVDDGAGRAWMRDGESLVSLTENRRRAIYAEQAGDFSAEICTSATFEDLSQNAIRILREHRIERLKSSSRNQDQEAASRVNQLPDTELLRSMELMRGEKLTHAALVLLGSREGLRRHLPNAEISFEYRTTEGPGPAQERVDFQEGFFLCTDKLWEQVNLRNERQHYQDGLYLHEIPTFSERPVREVILNAVTHRSYQHPASIFLRQYPRRLVCESPGGLPHGITPDNILDEHFPRNRRIAETFQHCGLVERSGQGVDIMFRSAVRESKLPPSFEGTSANRVVVTLPGEVQDPRFVQFLSQIGEETLSHFGTLDFILLDKVRRRESLTPPMKERAKHLRRLGVLESVGRGRGSRFILSRRLYDFLGTPAEHTRQRGLDREHNLQLLLNHLRAAGAKGAPRDELAEVLPSLNENQIGYRLRILRDRGLATSSGHGRGARWYIVPNSASSDSDSSKTPSPNG